MAIQERMRSSYRTLVPLDVSRPRDTDVPYATPVDAIFSPIRSFSSRADSILQQLSWYDGPVYLLPSDKIDFSLLSRRVTARIHILDSFNNSSCKIFEGFRSSSYQHRQPWSSEWDLSLKRNYILWYAVSQGYDKILIVDDDILGLTAEQVRLGACSLEHYSIAGAFVDDYPDTSVIGHLCNHVGQQVWPFLSGSYLYIRTSSLQGFFPYIYNEDWLFMLPYILDGSLCAFGTIHQMPYNPFANNRKAAFQEFGEIVVEGLYALLSTQEYELRYNQEVWAELLAERKNELQLLSNALETPQHRIHVKHALDVTVSINPSECISYIKDWETDLLKWHDFLWETRKCVK